MHLRIHQRFKLFIFLFEWKPLLLFGSSKVVRNARREFVSIPGREEEWKRFQFSHVADALELLLCIAFCIDNYVARRHLMLAQSQHGMDIEGVLKDRKWSNGVKVRRAFLLFFFVMVDCTVDQVACGRVI
jgi:hypothetical protein